MGDVPIKSGKTKRKGSKEAAALRKELQAAKQENEKLKAKEGPMATLEPQELSDLLSQKSVVGRAEKDAGAALAEAQRTQALLTMLRTAYSLRWTEIQKKHGLPADMDMNWTSGEVFRKKKPKG